MFVWLNIHYFMLFTCIHTICSFPQGMGHYARVSFLPDSSLQLNLPCSSHCKSPRPAIQRHLSHWYQCMHLSPWSAIRSPLQTPSLSRSTLFSLMVVSHKYPVYYPQALSQYLVQHVLWLLPSTFSHSKMMVPLWYHKQLRHPTISCNV